MTRQMSFSKQENKVLPGFRSKLNNAESTEDVKKFFTYTVMELLDDIFDGEVNVNYEDILLKPEGKSCYLIKDNLLEKEGFQTIWLNSDIKRILTTLAEASINRYRHLETNPEKTKSKIKKGTGQR